ncbi:hypothetical protein BJ165DRAFT_1468544 [Panaeolus papilionaceus]|nr:hypothetical protein BJ165DRAFT_1468544 [Panaeolus papilionaceus]
MQLKLTTIIVSIAFARLAGAVALPEAEADSESLLSSHPLTHHTDWLVRTPTYLYRYPTRRNLYQWPSVLWLPY